MPESNEFDAAQFMKDLQRSTAQHAQVVARRPKGERLSESLGQAAQLLYDWTEMLRLKACEAGGVDPRQTYVWQPMAGSPADEDRTALAPLIESFCADREPESTHWLTTSPTRNPADWAIDYLERCFHTATDNLAGIAQLVEGSERLRAPITLARSVLEASATGCFITDTTVDRRERLRRVINLQMAEAKEAANQRRENPAERAPYDVEIAELMDFAAVAGFDLERYKPSDLGPARIKPESGRHDSASSIIDRILPGVGLSMWRSMSAVAHSRASQLFIPDEVGLQHELKPWQRIESVAFHTLPGILVVRELGQHLQLYLGWSFEQWPKVWDAVATQWHVAAGMDDARIRRELGLPPISST